MSIARRAERIEPPEKARIERVVRSALHQAEETLSAKVVSRLGADAVVRLEALTAGTKRLTSPENKALGTCWERSRPIRGG